MSNDIRTALAGRNDNLLELADAIVLAAEVDKLELFVTTYNRVAAQNAANARKSERKAARKPRKAPVAKPEAVTVSDWKSKPASKKQVARIVALAPQKGMHTMRNVKSGELMPITEANVAGMTAGGASKLYQGLKALPTITVKENVTVKPVKKPATIAPAVDPGTPIEDNVALHGFDARYA